jgi:hypothetical protein
VFAEIWSVRIGTATKSLTDQPHANLHVPPSPVASHLINLNRYSLAIRRFISRIGLSVRLNNCRRIFQSHLLALVRGRCLVGCISVVFVLEIGLKISRSPDIAPPTSRQLINSQLLHCAVTWVLDSHVSDVSTGYQSPLSPRESAVFCALIPFQIQIDLSL